MMNYETVIIGGGPVGLMLASELALAGVKTCVLERLEQPMPYSKALTLHPRTLELFEMRGVLERFASRGKKISSGHFSMLDTRLDFSSLDTSCPYTLLLPQTETEQLLEERARSLGAEVLRGAEVLTVTQNEEGVQTIFKDREGSVRTLGSLFAVGADGAGSVVRKHAGIAFSGTDSTVTAALGDVKLLSPPPSGVLSLCTKEGGVMIVPLSPDRYRVVLISPYRTQTPKDAPVTEEELKTDLIRMCGTDFGLNEPTWMSRFGNASRQAKQYRSGRLFLAGDAAHIHFPAGGQGLNVGLQDAMNLGWKLAAAVGGSAPSWLLDSYHAERHPVAEDLLWNTEAQTRLMDFTKAGLHLRSMVSDMLAFPDVNRFVAGQISAIDVGYEADQNMPPHRLNGKRLSDVALRLPDGSMERLYNCLHNGAYVLLSLKQGADNDHIPFNGLHTVCASLAEPHEEWRDVHTVLVRPDGHAAWAVDAAGPDAAEVIQSGIRRWLPVASRV
ncbi:monooxygenase [Bacillus mojavensis]|uniref:monooxygenase n=1 Tax=Bacillus mojavensis TaxID=72360 RepID=UPI002DBAC700|nr:monooxygenase [Bacillus mojavensis]MEC1289121.1 monooxygenase [Bacillus mojavensis]MEC1705741.1 monooxygenase [Bacillus mojavensis]MEC5249332.1 monooxygenase [Bacillus mojavensis]